MPGHEIILSNDKVLIYGEATRVEMKVGANATPAKMLPGMLVILDTTQGQVKEAAAKAHGILGIIDVDSEHSIGDPYDGGPTGAGTVGDDIPILIPNEGSFVALTMLANEDFIQGDKIVSAADGKTAELAVGSMGSQGDIVALAWDTISGAADKRYVARWCYTPEPTTSF